MRLISVPLHIHQEDSLETFLHNFEKTNSCLSTNYHWYIDANGCSDVIETRLISNLKKYSNVTLHIEHEGSRHLAMNRSLQFARENNYSVAIFFNDDLEVIEGTFDILAELIEGGEEIVGALSTPKDSESDAPRRELNSISLHAEHYFYNKTLISGGGKFRGDCFAMKPNFIEEFPNIHADDSFLRLLHLHRLGKEITVPEGAQVLRVHEWKAKDSIRRMVRYFESRQQIVSYIKHNFPMMLDSSLKIMNIPKSKELRGRFIESRDNIRGKMRDSLKGGRKFDYDPELRLEFAKYADIAMLYMAIRSYEGGQREIESGRTNWRR